MKLRRRGRSARGPSVESIPTPPSSALSVRVSAKVAVTVVAIPTRPQYLVRCSRTLLSQLTLPERDARECGDFAALLGIEGTAARLYFAQFPKMLSKACSGFGAEFSLLGRNRRPPPDPINALLSFCYSMLTKDLVAVTLGVGLDPYLGVFHRSRHSRPALALDLAEEFRPLIADSVVIGVLNNGEIGPRDFVRRGGAVALTGEGRKSVLRAYERRLDTAIRHPVFGYRITYRRVLDVQARLLAAVLVGELPEYMPMVTR
ncbi:MAG TPA: CRISPR-associated endonuclease Cas1 [Mycobacterium sp.]|nr:CRISPR-associated endonuclease Cas1 [Mycobacterium sp.]